MRRNATSAESTFGGGRKTVRETGWSAGPRASASWTSTETAPYAFVDGAAKKRSATSRCTITHQRLDRREPGEALGDDRRGDVVGEVRDELRRRRLETRRGRAGARRPSAATRSRRAPSSRECGSSRRSSSTAWTWAQRSARSRVRTPRPGPDLEHDVVGVELGEPGDDAEDVVVDEEVLAEGLLRRDAHGDGRPKAASAFRSIRRSSAARLVAADVGQHGERVEDVRRLVALAAHAAAARGTGCPSRRGSCRPGTRRGRLAKLSRLRVRDVAGERDVVAALERRLEQAGRREAVEDDGAGERGQRGRGVGLGVTGVDDDGSPSAAASSSWLSKSTRCSRRCVVSRK